LFFTRQKKILLASSFDLEFSSVSVRCARYFLVALRRFQVKSFVLTVGRPLPTLPRETDIWVAGQFWRTHANLAVSQPEPCSMTAREAAADALAIRIIKPLQN
jgi:hypothetical protein